jgi:26S proteasome regulatory subunit N2
MLNTATSYLAMLQEEDVEIRSHVLDKINLLVDEYWAEISDYITNLENLFKNKEVPEKQELIALILSKIFYNLEDYDSAIDWALEAGSIFNILERSQYINTLLKKIIEKYISIRKNNFFEEVKLSIDERINKIVERIFSTCIENKEVNQAIGFSLECYDLERVILIINL